jgi:hypothetical protein|tara:strand:+ start:63 stop:251 length:189 start_codon:yes stop_codon:yes gene_type:complete
MKQSIILNADSFRTFDNYVMRNQGRLSWTYEVERIHDRYKVTLLNEKSVSLYQLMRKIEHKS